MKTVIVNCGIGAWHPAGSARLRATVNNLAPTVHVQCWNVNYPPRSENHTDIPYHFKPMSMQWARDQGYEAAVWMDSSVWLNKSIQPILDLIEQDGYFLIRNGWKLGEWCADSALEPLGLTREDSFNYGNIIAGVIGLNFNNTTANTFLDQWTDVAPTAYKGAWWNKNKECSQDERVLGHRHDQTAASIISCRLGMKWHDPQGWIEYASNEREYNREAILLCQGM